MSDGRAALAFALAAAACSSGGAARSKTQGFTGDDLLAAGDYDGAARLYERDIADAGGGTPAMEEKLLNARVRAASTHATAALAALDAGDVERATLEVRRAKAYAPGLPIVREAQTQIEARNAAAAKAAALRDQGRAALASDPAEAARLLDAAADVSPNPNELSRLRREATLRAEAERSAARAEAAYAAGDRATTARELTAAQVAGRPLVQATALRRRNEQDLVADSARADAPTLRASLAVGRDAGSDVSVLDVLRGRLVDRLLASARDLAATRRVHVAALLEIEAKRLNPRAKTPSLDRAMTDATTVILVRAFEDATKGRADGAALAKAVRERVNLDASGGGMPLVAIDDSPKARAGHPDAALLTGRVTAARRPVPLAVPADEKAGEAGGVTRIATAQFTARVELLRGTETLLAQDVNASADGAPGAAASEAVAKAADRFAALASGVVRTAAEAAPRRHFDAARAADREGRRDDAADLYALYLLSTSDVATSERADAARSLDELLGVQVVLRTGYAGGVR